MYLYTSQELQIMHEERVGNLVNKRQMSSRRNRRGNNSPLKQIAKLLKREEA